jgi:hypothetical protein
METEAFQDFMDHSFYDSSTDGGSESGEKRREIWSEGRPEQQQYPDYSSSYRNTGERRRKTSKLQPVHT